MLERQGALAEAITSPARSSVIALQVRDKNTSVDKLNTAADDEKSPTSSQLTTPTTTSFGSQVPSSDRATYVSPQRVQLSDVRTARTQSINDENAPPGVVAPRPTQRAHQAPSQQGRPPRLVNQKSIMSLR